MFRIDNNFDMCTNLVIVKFIEIFISEEHIKMYFC